MTDLSLLCLLEGVVREIFSSDHEYSRLLRPCLIIIPSIRLGGL